MVKFGGMAYTLANRVVSQNCEGIVLCNMSNVCYLIRYELCNRKK